MYGTCDTRCDMCHQSAARTPAVPPGSNGRMRLRASTKPVVLVLGSGWGAHSLIKVIDTDTYDVVVVSPRNHFLFTPMLPSTAVGTVEFRSLLEPIRTSNPCVTYLEAECDSLDPNGGGWDGRSRGRAGLAVITHFYLSACLRRSMSRY